MKGTNLLVILCVLASGAAAAAAWQTRRGTDAPVFVMVTCDPRQDAQSVDMALKFALFALDEGRAVTIFFTVKGVYLPSRRVAADFVYKDKPLQEQLRDLIARGADVHVCPVCMKALDVAEADIVVVNAKVTTRERLFARIGPSTAVFSF